MQTPQKSHVASYQIKVMTVLILLIESSIVCVHCFLLLLYLPLSFIGSQYSFFKYPKSQFPSSQYLQTKTATGRSF